MINVPRTPRVKVTCFAISGPAQLFSCPICRGRPKQSPVPQPTQTGVWHVVCFVMPVCFAPTSRHLSIVVHSVGSCEKGKIGA